MSPNLKTESKAHQQLAEWQKHEACWLAWPAHANLWQENLEPAQEEFVELCRAIADIDPKTQKPRGERLEILVATDLAHKQAEQRLAGLGARFHKIPYGDIWLRDTAPVFMNSSSGQIQPASFRFNGWGGKYELPGDSSVASQISKVLKLKPLEHSWVLEGGSVDVDGEGTLLTTRQCLLNPNRNPDLDQAGIEKRLSEAFGVKQILWLQDGLVNDHTDGHIDTLARFFAPGIIGCMKASSSDDPHAEALNSISRDLKTMVDAKGRKISTVEVPSPGKILDEEGEVMPASYMNFYIANTTVIVPTYGASQDNEAVAQIAAQFPARRTLGLSALAILSGGGAFHCITQQQPVTGVL